jgi:hypothetical protein
MTGTAPAGPPGASYALSVIHPGSPVLRVRYRHGVLVTPYGYPDWPLCARAVLELPPPPPGLTRHEVRVADVLAANLAMARAAAEPDGDPLWPARPGPAVPPPATDPAGPATTVDPAGPARPVDSARSVGSTGPSSAVDPAVPAGPRTPVEPAVATPAGWCWAHVAMTRQLALVPIELHGAFRHGGGLGTLPVTGSGIRVDEPAATVPLAGAEAVPEELLTLLEQALGRPLPAAYRRFLAATNGAGPAGPAVLPGHGFLADQQLFGIARADRHQDLSYLVDWLRDRLTADFLPIGYVQGGLLAVRIAGGDLDSVWYLDDDDPRDRDGLDADQICANLLTRCADSVDDLRQRLVEPPLTLRAVAQHQVDQGQLREVRDEQIGAGLPARMKAPWQPPDRGGRDALAALFEAR